MSKFSVISALVSVVLLSGCGKDLTSYAKYFEKKAGIPVQVHATDADTCLMAQLERIYSEYKALSRSRQAGASELLRQRYRVIHLNETRVGQVVSGELDTLVYYRRDCANGTCVNTSIGSKTLSDRQTYQGENPVTLVEKAETSLAITAQQRRNEALRKDYWTADVNVYDRADTLDDADFVAGRQSGTIWLNQEAAIPQVTCGETVGLTALLN